MTNLSTTTMTQSIVSMQEEPKMQIAIGRSAAGVRYGDVYISPSHIKFNEAFEGVTYRQRIIIKNVGYKPALIRIRQLNSIAFQVKALKSGIRVSPGLSITTYVTYAFKRTSISRAIIPIEINGKIFDYHVVSTLANEYISVEPKSIDFGNVDVGYSSGLKIITICNKGSKSTRFLIDLGQNDLDLIIKPLRGRIKPQKEVKLQVELIGANEGTFYSEFWIISSPNIRVPVKVHIIVPKLVIYHPNAIGDFTFIDFPPTIENTCRYDTFVLRNISSRMCSYIVLGEIDNEVKCIRDIDRKKYPTYSVFEIYPLEGLINPFQGIIFKVKFSPIKISQWKKEYEWNKQRKCENRYSSQVKNKDFMQFIRIISVRGAESEDIRIKPVKDTAINNILLQNIQIEESMIELPTYASSTDEGIRDVIKLCLYGEVELIQLYLEPDTLYLGNLIVGEISQRVLRLTNSSAVVPIYLEYVPNAAARCSPSWIKLKPNASIEVLIKVLGKESIEPSFKLLFNVVADSYDSASKQRLKIKVGSYVVECMVNIIFKSKKGLLSNKKSLPVKIDDEEEILKRILRSPKWIHKDYSKIIRRFTESAKFSLKKSIPSTEAAVLIPLSPLQIYKVQIYPTTFAFGMVASKSFNYRRLIVKNTNDVPIMIRLISLSTKNIYFSEGNLMIVQPNSTMSRLVEYFADEIGKFNDYINYVINDNHSFEINITACVVRKQLYIEKRDIEFGKEWLKEEVYQPMASIIQIANKLNVEIHFGWELPAVSGFHIKPKSGSIRSNSTLYAYVYCETDSVKDNYTRAMLKCESGSRVSVSLKAPRFVPRVEFTSDNVDLGEIPLNLPTKMHIVLRNFEFNEVTFEIDSASLIRGCSVDPLRGKISPRGIAVLEVHLTFEVCCRFAIVIAITIQKSLQLFYKISGSVSFPQLNLTPQRIDIKRLNIDACRTYQITATNVGTTLLKLQILLQEYPEFRVFLSANGKNSEISPEGIIIAPGTSRNLYLHVQPVDLVSYVFYLPIVINHLLGPVSMQDPKSIQPAEFLKLQAYYTKIPGFVMTPLPDKLSTVSIDYTVASCIISFSKLWFRFNATINKFSEELFIENQSTSRDVEMSIDIKEFSKTDCPFSMERSRGAEIRRAPDSFDCILHPGGSVSFVLQFEPKRHGSFSAEAPIYVRGELDDSIFNKLRLDGEFAGSSIDAEPTEIYFTPVPLDVAIEEKFRIRARHFDNVAFIRPNFLAPRYCGDYKADMLRVEFPNGNIVAPQSAYIELEGRIIFKSDQSISFCLTIEFMDDRARALCSLTVYATADNHLLTTYMYSGSNFDKCGEYLENFLSCLSISSNSAKEEDDCDKMGIPYTRRPSETKFTIVSRFNDQSSFVDKMTDANYSTNDRNNDCQKYVERIMTIAEEWLYSDPLEFRFYPSYPHGITAAFSCFCKRKKYVKNSKRKSDTIMPSYIDILQSLVGPNIHAYLGELSKQSLPENDIERIHYVLQLYNKMLDFLLSQGAYLFHVSPQFLLNYDDYLISIDVHTRRKELFDTNCVSRERLSRQLFESRNKHYWLDVILQTYKCLVLRGIHEHKSWMSPGSSRRSTVYRESIISSTASLRQYELHERAIRSIADSPSRKFTPDDRSAEEEFLLAWLQYHYEQQRERDWMIDRLAISNSREKQDVLESRTIDNFCSDLSDSLVLIAVTASYCPFLIDDYFNNLYIYPENKQEMLHNAICLVTAWRKIRLGFVITPMQLVDPNQVQMLMLVTHLFQILPTYVSCAKIKFSCSLSQTVTRQISVSNPTDNIVNYLLLLVNNVNRFFTILKPASVLRLNAHGNGQIQIQFHAKKIQRSRAYLVLCGRAIGPHFGRNQTIVLEGDIDNLGIANEYVIRSKLYEIVETNLKINVPYKNAAEYDIWVADEQPGHPLSLKMTCWREMKTRKVLRRFFLNQDSIIVAEGASAADLSISVGCIIPKQQKFWLIFQSRMGDFIISINSVWQRSINDRIVVEWTAQNECICSNQRKDNCPFNISLPIPSCNVQLQNCIAEMFKKTLESRECLFWSKYSNTNVKLQLMKWLMKDDVEATSDFIHVFNSTVTYKVTTSDKSGLLFLPECFTIQDVRLPHQVPMTIHVSSKIPLLHNAMIILTSLDNKEVRTYNVSCLRL